jgi:hypothetical protein
MSASAPKAGKPANSLLAAIAGKLDEQEADSGPKEASTEAKAPESAQKPPRNGGRSSGAKTVLVGGHFPPAVLQQLRMIAAEEGTTNQALLAEALDLLFLKKGKARIERL